MTHYYHRSEQPIDHLEDLKYTQDNFKPSGFWFSVNNEWLEWCQENNIFHSRDDYQYEIRFNSDKIYSISSLQDLENFRLSFPTRKNSNWIDWTRVSKEYDGIVFHNYREMKRELYKDFSNINKYTWFFGLDCSCGCIWNLRVITSFSLLNLE